MPAAERGGEEVEVEVVDRREEEEGDDVGGDVEDERGGSGSAATRGRQIRIRRGG